VVLDPSTVFNPTFSVESRPIAWRITAFFLGKSETGMY
jgi:hypothetical protein